MRNSALSIVCVLIILFLLEMTLRATEVIPYRSLLLAGQTSADPAPGPFLPGQALTIRTRPDRPYRVSINRLGFRGHDIHRARTTGTLRMVALGGASTFGLYVDGEDTWPARLETFLREEHPEMEIGVINAGVDGFGISEVASFLEERILGLEPDLVILGLSPESLLSPGNPDIVHESHDRLLSPLRQTATFQLLRMTGSYILGGNRSNGPPPAAGSRPHVRAEGSEAPELASVHGERLESISGLLREEGIPLVVLLFPARKQVVRDGAEGGFRRRLAIVLHELEVPLVDLLPAYRHYDRDGSKYFLAPPGDHPSARGYRRGARELVAALQPLLLRWENPAPAGASAAAAGGEQ